MINNKLLISEFQKLINYIQFSIDNAKKNNDNKSIIENTFRLKHIKYSLNIIKKYNKTITLNNYTELKNINGIGKGTISRIEEILKNGFLNELINFKNSNQYKIIEELIKIIGIGYTYAFKLYKQGVKSIQDLKKKILNNEIKVNNKIKLGIKYYGKFYDNIPRKEMKYIYKLLKLIIKKLNKNLNNNNKFIIKMCGSYRRKKMFSNDIDILISKYDYYDINNYNYLKNIIKILKKPLKNNNNNPFIIDDITDKNIKTKYMGFCKYKDNLIRRIDICFVPINTFIPALLYFTGSANFNKKMRNIARKKGYKLSEYGLTKLSNNKLLHFKKEKEIFDLLNMEYLKPEYRL